MTSRLPPLVGLLLVVAAIASAQRPSGADLEQMSSADALALAPDWLQHGDSQQRAWAAYWIGRDRQEQQIPELLDGLASYQASAQAGSSSWSDNDYALLVVLDALIQLKADVSPESAEALYAKFPVRALVLLAQSHEDPRQALLRIFDGKSGARVNWLAVADLLAASPPPSFAARLLKQISIHATVNVLSPGQGFPGAGMAGDCGGSLGDGPRLGWPPVGAYRLAWHPSSGSELLAAGENPVYLVRTLTRDYGLASRLLDDCTDLLYVTVSDLSRDLIGQLLGLKKDTFALQLDPDLNITWKSAKSYLNAATAFVLKQDEIVRNAEAGLKARGRLTRAEAASERPPIEVEIRDVRINTPPLPHLVFADPAIHVTYEGEGTVKN